MGCHVGELSHGHVTSLISLVYSLENIEKQKVEENEGEDEEEARKLLVQNIVTSYFLDLLRHQ